MEKANKASVILFAISLPVFASSFFVRDSNRAVNRRYLALGLFGAGWALELLKRSKITDSIKK
jgi:hypothetical protein